MKNKIKRGFTIVELVIVIAVIGVLAAILIPTFATFINSAKVAADTQMVKNLNTALAADEVLNGKHETAYDAIKVANQTGYSVEKLTPTSLGYEVVWDKKTDRFILIDKDGKYKFFDQNTEPSNNKKDLWKIYKLENILMEDGTLNTNEEYSIYLANSDEKLSSIIVNGQNLDIGENKKIQSVTCAGTGEMMIRTNGQELIVNADAENSTVHHVGYVSGLELKSAKTYHEYGHVVAFLNDQNVDEFIAHDGASFHQDKLVVERLIPDAVGLDKCIFAESNFDGGVCIFCGESKWENVVSDFDAETGTIYEIDSSKIGENGEITIPKSIGGVPVKTIGEGAFGSNPSLKSVIIPEGIESIESSAFMNCTSLTNIILPESLTTIEDMAFIYCPVLESIDLSKCNNLTTIKPLTFCYCGSLNNIVLPAGLTVIEESVFSSCTSLTNIILPAGLKTIGNGVFANCSSLTNIVLPEGIETIGNNVFGGCSSLTNVTLPSGIKSIGEDAFKGCKTFTEIDLTNCTSLTIIEESAFENCIKLNKITLPSSVNSIGNNVFSGCKSLTEVNLSNCTSLTTIGNASFSECTSLTNIDLTSCTSLTSIGASAFYKCTNLQEIKLPNSLTTIGNNAFSNCTSLTSIDLSSTKITEINYNTFLICSKLESVLLPSTLTTIGNSAFYNCQNLTTISLPNTLTSIENSAFNNSVGTSLTTVNYNGTQAEWEQVTGTDNLPSNVTINFKPNSTNEVVA